VIKADLHAAYVPLKKEQMVALSWSFIFELGIRFANLQPMKSEREW
jgi:hypothetical protein